MHSDGKIGPTIAVEVPHCQCKAELIAIFSGAEDASAILVPQLIAVTRQASPRSRGRELMPDMMSFIAQTRHIPLAIVEGHKRVYDTVIL